GFLSRAGPFPSRPHRLSVDVLCHCPPPEPGRGAAPTRRDFPSILPPACGLGNLERGQGLAFGRPGGYLGAGAATPTAIRETTRDPDPRPARPRPRRRPRRA